MNSRQLKAHVETGDGYMVINGKVIDVTDFIEEHPGGEEALLENIGKDATEKFREVGHSEYAHMMLDDLYVCDFEPSLCSKLGRKLVCLRGQVLDFVRYSVPTCVKVTVAVSLGAAVVVLARRKL